MATQWSATIASQTVAFRGTSAIAVKATATGFPGHRAIVSAVYGLNVTGGVSGNFSCVVAGTVGGTTFLLVGATAITAAGSYILHPIGYSNSGAVMTLPLAGTFADLNHIEQTVPPSYVYLIANTGTAGISANCTVGAVLLSI